jgi:hypothetical protein
MLTEAAFVDLREFIKRQIAYAEFRIDTTYYRAEISETEITSTGVVRVKIPITHPTPATINQVRLYSRQNQVWASKDINVTTNALQTHYLQWFDFNITEVES